MAAIKSLSVSFINMGQQVSRLIVSLLTVSWFSFFGYVGKASLGAKKTPTDQARLCIWVNSANILSFY